MAKHLLLYGNDPLLLQIRAMVLEHSGFLVSRISSLSSLTNHLASSRQLGSSPADLLVFCHTLSSSERQAAYVLCRTLSPAAKIITLAANEPSATEDIIELLNIADGPQALVDRSRQLTA